MICPMCGNQISDTVKFCPVCGNPIAASAALKDKEEADSENIVYEEETLNEAEGGPGVLINGTAEETAGKNGFAIASLIMGIVAVPCDYIFLIPSVLAIIFSIIGIAKASSSGVGRGMSVAGLVLGIIAAVLWLSVSVIVITLLGAVISIMNF